MNVRALARPAAWAGGAVMVLCVGVLIGDDIAGRRQTREYDQRVLKLQQLIRNDASHAPELEAEHKRVSQARRDRKARINRIAIVLAAAASVFLWGLKRLQVPRPVPLAKIKKLKARPASAMPPAAAHAPPGTTADLSVVDEIVAREGRSTEAAIPILQAIQAHFRYLPDEALKRVCELTEITPAQIAGTSSFYSKLRRSPVGKHTVRVCHGTACHVSGARQITEELRRSLDIAEGADTDPDRLFTIDEVACLGCCSLAPVLMINDHAVGNLTPASARQAIEAVEPKEPA